jgi:secondary thiamine-phosphate synthase enzyme
LRWWIITHRVQQEVEKAGVREGLCVVYVPHTTSGVTINEGADPAVCSDIIQKAETAGAAQ